MKRKKWDAAKELADTLFEWNRKRGVPPVTVGDESLGKEWHRTVTHFTCLLVISKVDHIYKRREQRKANTMPKGDD